ncbi:MAG TPA: barstar family protein [Lacisediminihabitans sp.]|uniref:barstar family protein n=1 Tax=Lacisediminihabitans sp. TaxID=2787631 RepID=UPI002ED7F063
MIEEPPLLVAQSQFEPLLLEASVTGLGTALYGWLDLGVAARLVRGRKMSDIHGLFDEFAAALQFPLYFGENGDAFNDCITDLPYLFPNAGIAIVISEPDRIEFGILPWLVSALTRASKVWAAPIELGEWWDRPPVPFHVILGGEADALDAAERLWTAAGASLARLPN